MRHDETCLIRKQREIFLSGLIPAERKKPLRRAPWEEDSGSDGLPEVELYEDSKEERGMSHG